MGGDGAKKGRTVLSLCDSPAAHDGSLPRPAQRAAHQRDLESLLRFE